MEPVKPGSLEIGTNGAGEVVIIHPDLQPDADGVGHIIFSPTQARHLGWLLVKKAFEAEMETKEIEAREGYRHRKRGPHERT
jgi:hypothetical protein